jgi:hypothetical protein
MKLSIALLTFFLAAAFSAGCGAGSRRDGIVPYEETFVACEEASNPQSCQEAASATYTAQRPTEIPPDPAVKQVFLRNSVVRQLIGDGVEREDYWLIIDSLGADPGHGDEGGMVVAAFRLPVSYSGPGPTRTSPCRAGADERVDRDDPCRDEPREYGTTQYDFHDVRVVHFQVDTGRGDVVWMFPDDTPDDIVEDMIRWAEENKY